MRQVVLCCVAVVAAAVLSGCCTCGAPDTGVFLKRPQVERHAREVAPAAQQG